MSLMIVAEHSTRGLLTRTQHNGFRVENDARVAVLEALLYDADRDDFVVEPHICLDWDALESESDHVRHTLTRSDRSR